MIAPSANEPVRCRRMGFHLCWRAFRVWLLTSRMFVFDIAGCGDAIATFRGRDAAYHGDSRTPVCYYRASRAYGCDADEMGFA